MASPNCTNTDISGVGVRSATYAQNLLSFVPAAVALFNDGKISNSEREFIKDQSTNILFTAFGLLLSAIIQAKTVEGMDNYHLVLIPETGDEPIQEELKTLLDFAVGIGSLHLSLMGALGVWLWANPMGFGK
ncbi:hypothetical protein B0H13DRAFT_2349858 [Mycena leptocephala]|nr:hypothetical protein B0H13DRAFT_2349858 [Mycena leptocephala]